MLNTKEKRRGSLKIYIYLRSWVQAALFWTNTVISSHVLFKVDIRREQLVAEITGDVKRGVVLSLHMSLQTSWMNPNMTEHTRNTALSWTVTRKAYCIDKFFYTSDYNDGATKDIYIFVHLICHGLRLGKLSKYERLFYLFLFSIYFSLYIKLSLATVNSFVGWKFYWKK